MSPEYSYLRVEKHQIKPSNKYYKLLDELCFKSKNLYNTRLYIERQAFLEKDQSLKEARFIPHKTHITLEIAYEIKEESSKLTQDFKYLAGIDLGIDNFSTISILKGSTNPLIINGKGLKSYNRYFNKKLAHLKSEAQLKNKRYTTKRIQRLIKKRNNYIDTWIHKASRITANYLYKNQVKAVIIGKNKNWKQNSKLSKKVNQTFIQIPFES